MYLSMHLAKKTLKIQPTDYRIHRAYPPKGTDPTWVVWYNSTRKKKQKMAGQCRIFHRKNNSFSRKRLTYTYLMLSCIYS